MVSADITTRRKGAKMDGVTNVLLADDERVFCDTAARVLRDASYAVECAADVVEASRMLSAKRYGSLIANIQMPGNQELELVHRANQLEHKVPVIVVTKIPELATAIKALNLAVIGYLVKPVAPEDLRTQVENSITRNRAHNSLGSIKEQLPLWQRMLDDLEAAVQASYRGNRRSPAEEISRSSFNTAAEADSGAPATNSAGGLSPLSAPPKAKETLTVYELMEHALRETIQTLAETKHSFKSKRLKELRQQLQGVLGVWERERTRVGKLAPPHYGLMSAPKPR